jgi:uncharacterized SAM-binding protein YcdF (DUF218 family)
MKRPKIEVYSYKGARAPKWLKAFTALLLAGVLTFSACLWTVLAEGHSDMHSEPDTMIILGCMVYEWGPSILLRDRLDTALDYLEEHPDTTVIVSGGQGADEHISEAQAMHDYLVEHGFPSAQILLEDQSSNTYENLSFSNRVIAAHGIDVTDDIVVVSNDFHLARVRMLFKRVAGGDYHLNTLAAPTSHLPSRIKMYIREPLALIKSFLCDGW